MEINLLKNETYETFSFLKNVAVGEDPCPYLYDWLEIVPFYNGGSGLCLPAPSSQNIPFSTVFWIW